MIVFQISKWNTWDYIKCVILLPLISVLPRLLSNPSGRKMNENQETQQIQKVIRKINSVGLAYLELKCKEEDRKEEEEEEDLEISQASMLR